MTSSQEDTTSAPPIASSAQVRRIATRRKLRYMAHKRRRHNHKNKTALSVATLRRNGWPDDAA